MSDPLNEAPPSPYETFLSERLERMRQENPSHPLPYLRMQLIQALHQEHALPFKEAMRIVDEFYNARGLGIRQPTVMQAILFGIVASLIFVIPMLVIYWLWLQFRPR